MHVTPAAAVEIETWAQAVGNRLNLVEHIRGRGEKIQLVLAEAGKRAARAGSAPSRTRVKRFSPGAAATASTTRSVVWRDILSEVVMQIEAASVAILRKSGS